MSPIGYDKVNKETGEYVDPDHVIRGFEFAKGKFVELTDDDVDRLDIELTHAIDICDFVSIDEIDPLYFRKAYYLLPQDGAEKPYRLLLKALEESGPVAIAKIVIRNKQHLACVRPVGKTLLLETMYYAGRSPAPGGRPRAKVRTGGAADGEDADREPHVQMGARRYHDRTATSSSACWRRRREGEPLPEPQQEPAARSST